MNDKFTHKGFEVTFINDSSMMVVKDLRTKDTVTAPVPDPATYKGVFARSKQAHTRVIERFEAMEHAVDNLFEYTNQAQANGPDDRESMATMVETIAKDIPVDLWSTYGGAPRQAVLGFQEWMFEKANRIREGK